MRQQDTSFYMGSLDGLRFASFVFVYCAHLPLEALSLANRVPIQTAFTSVDLFFVISAYLLWRLMDAEYHKRGGVNVRDFYLRRVLRIYPLLVTFYTCMFVLRIIQTQAAPESVTWLRFAANIFAFENILVWPWNWNDTVPAVGQFWTLAFEVQVYLLLPWAFRAWKKHGTRALLVGVVLVELASFAARWWAVDAGVSDRGVYVIPFFRPEAVLLGIVLAVIRPAWNATWSVMVAVVAAVATMTLPAIDQVPYGTTYTYFASAITVAALVDAGLRFAPLRAFLTLRPIRYLGMITYGLYVFHIAAIWTVVEILRQVGVDGPVQGPAIIVLSLILTFAAAALSFKYLESPFLRLKRRFEAVHARGDSPDELPASDAPADDTRRVNVP